MPARLEKCLNKPMKPSSYENIKFQTRLFLSIVDFIGTILFLPAKVIRLTGNQKFNPAKVKNIIVYRLDGLGDLALSLKALSGLRETYSQAHITLVVGPWSEPLARLTKYYDELVVYDSYLFSIFRKSTAFSFKKEINFFQKIRQRKYDLGIDLRGDILSIIPLVLSRARYRFAKATQGGGFLLTDIVNISNLSELPDSQRNAEVIAAVGVENKDREIELNVKPCVREKIKPLVVIAPLALYRWRTWPKKNFDELSQRLVAESGVDVISIEKKMEFTGLVSLIKDADLFIGNDSGLNHIAALFKIPLVQLFGPGIAKRFGHYYDRARVLQDKTCPYHPCPQPICKNKENWCMEKISVDEVVEAAKESLLRRPCGPPRNDVGRL